VEHRIVPNDPHPIKAPTQGAVAVARPSTPS
jgi:hypothetical protein